MSSIGTLVRLSSDLTPAIKLLRLVGLWGVVKRQQQQQQQPVISAPPDHVYSIWPLERGNLAEMTNAWHLIRMCSGKLCELIRPLI